MTDEELKALVASLAISQQETDRRQQETDRQMKETDKRQQETDRQQKETDRQLKELGKQIGGLGNKFGGFTEGLALPSMSKVLRDHFKADRVLPRPKSFVNGRVKELDVLAYSHGELHAAYVVEIKSLLNDAALHQTLKTLEEFPHFFPDHQNKALYGILAYVDFREDALAQAKKQGLYLATIQEDLFELQSPPDFQPKNFQS